MSEIYDNWEKLVGAVIRREKDRQLVYCESFSTSYSTDFSSEFADVSSQKIFFSRDVKAIEYEEIRKATRNFRPGNMLGGGPFCCVYKGWIDEHYAAAKPGFGIPVAVKMLNNTTNLALENWLDEINNLSHLHHPNLLTPIGYSYDKDIRILVYEFLPKGSLDNYLFTGWQRRLPWETRIKVAVGAAKALAFLHQLETPVIYRNFRSDNIILDNVSRPLYCQFIDRTGTHLLFLGLQDFNAKLSDIGLSKDIFGCGIEDPHGIINQAGASYGSYPAPECITKFWHISLPTDVSTHELEDLRSIVDEIGAKYSSYDAPEYIATGHLSTECDVYSFGVFLIELMLGFRALDEYWAFGEHDVMDWAKSRLGNERKLSKIMDGKLKGQYPYKEAYEVGKIAFECASSDPRSRPKMAEVVAALQEL